MYREIVTVNAKAKKEAVINLMRVFKQVLTCAKNSQIQCRALVPDNEGSISDSDALKMKNPFLQ